MRLDEINFLDLKDYFPDIFISYIHSFDKLKDFFKVDYRNLDDLASFAKARVSKIDHDLLDSIEKYNKLINAPSKSLESLDKLRNGACCVVAGQQPGLFLGPMYNIYKCITAIKLAGMIQDRAKVHCLPVFWNHSDDHNLKAFNRTIVPQDSGFTELLFDKDNIPAYLCEDVLGLKEVITRFRGLLPQSSFTIKLLDECLDQSYSHFFSKLLMKLFGRFGLICVEPYILDSEKLKSFYEHLMKAPVTISMKISDSVYDLGQKGFKSALKDATVPGLYLIEGCQRKKIQYIDGYFYLKGTKLTPEEITSPSTKTRRISPQFFIRPLVQDFLFPTCAYVSGPNEVNYLAGLYPIYHDLCVTMPAIFPRISATLIDPATARDLNELSLNFKDLLTNEFTSNAGPDVTNKLNETISKIEAELILLKDVLVNFDKGLDLGVQRAFKKINIITEALKKRVASAIQARGGTINKQVDKFSKLILPERQLQERTINSLYLLSKYPEAFMNELMRQLDIFNFAHRVIYC